MANCFSSRVAAIPQCQSLFEDIARYTSSLRVRHANTPLRPAETLNEGPATKRRKLQNGDATEDSQSSANLNADASLQFYMRDVSFTIPQRKKLTLEITAGQGYLRARNQTTQEVEFGVPMDRIREWIY